MKTISGKQLAKMLWSGRDGNFSVFMAATIFTAKMIPLFASLFLSTIHGNKPLKTGLLKHLLQMAGLKKEDVG